MGTLNLQVLIRYNSIVNVELHFQKAFNIKLLPAVIYAICFVPLTITARFG